MTASIFPRQKTLRALAGAALALVVLPGLCVAKGNNGAKGLAVPPQAAAQARHVILFIGDGMQLEHEVAYSRYLTGEDFGLAWNRFPYEVPVATWDVTTYNRYARLRNEPAFSYDAFDPLVGYDPARGGAERFPLDPTGEADYFLRPRYATDSASAATAMATGLKTDDGNIAWLSGDPADGALTTIAELLRERAGAAIGVVSTVPFSHATPAAFVSHNVSRNHYYTGRPGFEGRGIADEIVHETRPEVVIGGGHPNWDTTYVSATLLQDLRQHPEYLLVEREEGRDGGAALLAGAKEAAKRGKKLFGLFGGRGGHFEPPVAQHSPGAPTVTPATVENPSLAEAALAALQVLGRDDDGFFLVVEQGDIDWANHANDYLWMMGAMHDLHEAVRTAVDFVNRPGDAIDWTNTLLVVTSDHGNSYMRLVGEPLGAGELPLPQEIVRTGQTPPEGVAPRVTYGTGSHTNELVSLYANGAATGLFEPYEGSWYPETRIVDNTQIHEVMIEFATDWTYEGWKPGMPRKPFLFGNGEARPAAR